MTTTNEQKIRECPFCGNLPVIKFHQEHNADEILRCETPNCILCGEMFLMSKWNTRYFGQTEQPDKSLEEIVEKWLYRTPSCNYQTAKERMEQACIEYAAQLQRDKERLDWLEKDNNADRLHCDATFGHYVEQFEMEAQPNVRAAIDAAQSRKESK